MLVLEGLPAYGQADYDEPGGLTGHICILPVSTKYAQPSCSTTGQPSAHVRGNSQCPPPLEFLLSSNSAIVVSPPASRNQLGHTRGGSDRLVGTAIPASGKIGAVLLKFPRRTPHRRVAAAAEERACCWCWGSVSRMDKHRSRPILPCCVWRGRWPWPYCWRGGIRPCIFTLPSEPLSRADEASSQESRRTVV
jgi:hypothetical protein